ncbi:MAG: hypothetical protein ACFFG0_53240 [Candidatus Thorarchaeota archaeon]
MKIETISEKTRTTKTTIKKLKIGRFIIIETYKNGKLVFQEWTVEGGFKKSHPNAYEPKSMFFKYYDDISFLNSESNTNQMSFYDEIPKEQLIKDWSNFKGFDHVLCIYLGMDGFIYRIDKPNPIPMWRHKDYISSFDNKHFDLDMVVKKLKRFKWIRNIKIVKIPYYNVFDEATHAVEFDYKYTKERLEDDEFGLIGIHKKDIFGLKKLYKGDL